MAQTSDRSNCLCLKQLGALIRQRRRAFGLTQAEFAAIAEVSTNLLSQVEQGKTTAQIGKLLDILQTAGLQFDVVDGNGRIKIQGMAE